MLSIIDYIHLHIITIVFLSLVVIIVVVDCSVKKLMVVLCFQFERKFIIIFKKLMIN